jgi:hypothetical protein
VALYPLDGNAQDVSGKGNHGTPSGAVPASGLFGGAYLFDGDQDYIDIGNLDISGTEMTISAWTKANTFDSDGDRFVTKAYGPTGPEHYWMLGLYESGGRKVRGRVKAAGSTITFIASAGTVQTGVWTHTAMTYDGSFINLYKDGELVDTTPKSGELNTDPTVAALIGSNPGGYGDFDGLIDDVSIWNRSLSPAEILELNSSGTPVSCNSTNATNATNLNQTAVQMLTSANSGNIDFRFTYPLSASKGMARTEISEFQVRSAVPLAAIHKNITYLADRIRSNDPYDLGPECGRYMANEITILNNTIIRFAVNLTENGQYVYQFAFDTTVSGSCYQ